MPETISVGELSYDIVGNWEKLETQLREYEQKGDSVIRIMLEADAGSIERMHATIQAAMRPIVVTLDTTQAERQIAGLGGTMPIGGGAGGGAASGFGMGPMDLGGGGPWSPGQRVGVPTVGAGLDPPSMESLEIAGFQERTSNQASNIQNAMFEQGMAGAGGGGGSGGGGGLGLGQFGALRLLMLTHFAAQGAMGIERYEDLNYDMERTHDPLEGLSRARANINAQRGGMGGLVGMGAQAISSFGQYTQAGMIAEAAGFDLGQFDVNKGLHELEGQEDELKRQRQRQDQKLRYEGLSNRMGLGTYGGGGLGKLNEEADVASADEDRQPVTRLNRAYDAALSKIDEAAAELEKLGNNSPEARSRAARYKSESKSALSVIHDADVFEAWNTQEQQENAAALQVARSDADLAYRGALVGARGLSAGGDQLGGALALNAARYQRGFDSLDWVGDQVGALTQLQVLNREHAQDDSDAMRDETLRGLRGPVAAAVRRNALDASTDAIHRGAGRFAGAFGNVVGIEGGANLGIDEGTVTGDFGQAFSAAQGGISQLRNLEAQISAGNRSQSVDPLYANLSGSGGGETARLLQDIRSAIDRLTSRLKGIGATD